MDRITLNIFNVIESKTVATNRIDDFLRQKIEKTKTKAGEARGALDRNFMGTDFDEGEEIEDETEEAATIRRPRGLPIERLSPKQISSNLSDAVTAKLGEGKLAVQLEVTVLWVRKEQSVLRNKLQIVQLLWISAYGGGPNPKLG